MNLVTNSSPIVASLETFAVATGIASTFDIFDARQAADGELEGLRLAAIAAGELCRGMTPNAADWTAMEAAEAAYEGKRATLYGARK
jgi:hypothetical protein